MTERGMKVRQLWSRIAIGVIVAILVAGIVAHGVVEVFKWGWNVV